MSFFAISSVGQPYFGLQDGKEPIARKQIKITWNAIELFLLMRIFILFNQTENINDSGIFLLDSLNILEKKSYSPYVQQK